MKKLIYLLLMFVPGSVFGQITGDGTYGSPYTGTLTTGSFTISTTPVYFHQIVVSGGTLTINAGMTVFAKNTTSFITITSTGVLTANGSSGNIITFSADNDGDGTAETGETWKNLLFDNSTGTSIVNFALVERGTGEETYAWGGGIFVYGNNITISNSTIRYCNIDGEGGGVYLYPMGTNVTVQNLIIHDNTATGNGGGLVIDGESAITVTGCEIYNNSSNASGDGVYFRYSSTITNSFVHNHSSGEGVYVDMTGASIRNCVIYNNNAGMYFNAVGNAVNCDVVKNTTGIIAPNASKIVNTVLWGNTTQYTGSSIEFAYCGIQDWSSGGTNKPLSATNVDDTGPNFVNTSSNFHINAWITPLVDGGTASYTGVIIPGTDIEGSTRIGALDIGAYEFVYYIWTGVTSTDWTTTSNWTGSPSSVPTSITDNKVIIPAGCLNYPTLTGDLSLSTRSILTIEPNAGLKVTGATSVGSGCTFLLASDANGSANFITGTSVSGNFKVELFLAGGGDPDYRWHYVTTPENGYTSSALLLGNNPYNLLWYREDLVTTDKNAGWKWYDDATYGFTTLQIGRGYNVYVASDQTAIFTSSILAGSLDFKNSSITCGSGDATQRGWNLIGNPFTSAVDANQFVLSSKLVDKSIYFTKDNQYLSWNTFTHEGVGTGVSNIVPALQGFFVHANTGPGEKSVKIPANSRLYTTNSLYKGAQESHDFPFLKFNVADGTTFSDESIIYFFNDATTSFDTDYDAYKLLIDNQAHPQIYTISNGTKFSMNGLPYPDKITTVPLNLRIGIAKNYTINVLNIENLTDCKVTLIHGTNRVDLKTNPNYTFFGAAGTLNDMSIEFDMSGTTDVNIPEKDHSAFWYSNGVISIKTGQDGFEDNSTVLIYDINGRAVFNKSGFNLVKGDITQIPVYLQNGLYITSVLNNYKKLVQKIAVVE